MHFQVSVAARRHLKRAVGFQVASSLSFITLRYMI